LTEDVINSADLVLLITDHDSFDLTTLETAETAVLDTKNRLTGSNISRL
jgi:UDP-N-acetyl-D-mannosaminuronate dehydrogenase